MNDSADFETLFPALGLGDTQHLAFTQTIGLKPADPGETISDVLPILSLDGMSRTSEPPAHFGVQKELGRGGMGIVQLATQRALGREVAIKTVLPERRSRSVEDALLQEARVMGLVEHPNVVPVHLIGRDDEDRPVIVMKRVEGTAWDELLAADDPGTLLDVSNRLEFHLDVLVKVGQALAFSHSRGILHRDIKPANVMLGAFGEVYLLDWGLAVSLPGFDLPTLPRSIDANYVCGTPHYMAPEMTVGRGSDLGPHTDVYILGAILYQIVTGAPPHQGKSLFEVMRASYEGRRLPYPAKVPREICDITDRAMSVDPDDRFGTVGAFLEAVEGFRRHRSSYILTTEATQSLEALRSAVAAGNESDKSVIEAYRRFGAARFGFEQALDVWRQNEAAQQGLEETLREMIDFELRRKNPEAAAALAADLTRPDESIARRIEEALEARSQQAQELEVLRNVYHDFDASIGLRIKAWLIVLLGVAFVGLWLATYLWRQADEGSGRIIYVLPPVAFFPVMLAIAGLGWKTFRANVANRVMIYALWLMWGYGAIIRGGTVMAKLPYGPSIAFELLLFSLGAGMMSLTLYRRMIIPTCAFFIGAITTLVLPGWGFEIYAGAGAVACFGFAAAVFASGES